MPQIFTELSLVKSDGGFQNKLLLTFWLYCWRDHLINVKKT